MYPYFLYIHQPMEASSSLSMTVFFKVVTSVGLFLTNFYGPYFISMTLIDATTLLNEWISEEIPQYHGEGPCTSFIVLMVQSYLSGMN